MSDLDELKKLVELEKEGKGQEGVKLLSRGGFDIIDPKVWDKVLISTIKKLHPEKFYIFEFSRGIDPKYLTFFKISKEKIYERCFELIFTARPEIKEAMIIHIKCNFFNRLKRNQKRKKKNDHFVAEKVMRSIYSKDIFHYIRRGFNYGYLSETVKIPVYSINNSRNLGLSKLQKYFRVEIYKALGYYNSMVLSKINKEVKETMKILHPKLYAKVLKVCASQEEVKEEVLRNYEDNTWWPRGIEDWRIRFLVAGLSARVSYRMIKTYQRVVEKLKKHSYEEIVSLKESEVVSIIRPLGLINLRMRFWRSAINFISGVEKMKLNIIELSNDELISLIRKEVEGVDYHLAQCCALYLKGYHSGIIPVDSGMVKTFAPCLGFPIPSGVYGYEVLRKELEELSRTIDCSKIATTTGYQSLTLPQDRSLTWWLHLVLIYYKRIFCNRRDPKSCPLKREFLLKEFIGQMCDKNNPQMGGIKRIIFEGIEGAGKTTMAEMFSKIGFRKLHGKYHPEIEDLYSFYNDVLEKNRNQRLVFDRSFISELVYGPTLRKKSRLSTRQLKQLLGKLKSQQSLLVYLYAPLETLLERKKDKTIPVEYYPLLIKEYEKVLKVVEIFIPVLRINTGENDPKEIFHLIAGFEFPKKF